MSICLYRDISEGDVVEFEYVQGDNTSEIDGTVIDVNHDERPVEGDAPRSLVVDCDEQAPFYVSIEKMIVRRERHTRAPGRLLSLRQK